MDKEFEINKTRSAFPTRQEDVCCSEGVKFSGLTKREYFAVKAMQGILSSRGLQRALNQDRIALEDCAVDYADRLLSALEKK